MKTTTNPGAVSPGRPRLALAAVLLALAAPAARADVVTLVADRDNTLFEDANGALSNGSGPVTFAGNNGQDLARRALLRFDVAGALPYGARIDAVELRLNCSNASNATPRIFTLHRVVRDWGEGASSTTSGAGTAAAEGDATWIHTFYPTQTWTSAGGDFAAVASASLSVGDVGAYVWTDVGMKADVQEWLNGTAPNFGWLLFGDETVLNTARRFDARENTITTNRPALTIQYSYGTTAVGEEARAHGPSLEAASPNPSQGDVRVAFRLPSSAAVRLEVTDLAGRRVATLADGRFDPGRTELLWKGEGLAPGLYFCRLRVDGRAVAVRALARIR